MTAANATNAEYFDAIASRLVVSGSNSYQIAADPAFQQRLDDPPYDVKAERRSIISDRFARLGALSCHMSSNTTTTLRHQGQGHDTCCWCPAPDTVRANSLMYWIMLSRDDLRSLIASTDHEEAPDAVRQFIRDFRATATAAATTTTTIAAPRPCDDTSKTDAKIHSFSSYVQRGRGRGRGGGPASGVGSRGTAAAASTNDDDHGRGTETRAGGGGKAPVGTYTVGFGVGRSCRGGEDERRTEALLRALHADDYDRVAFRDDGLLLSVMARHYRVRIRVQDKHGRWRQFDPSDACAADAKRHTIALRQESDGGFSSAS